MKNKSVLFILACMLVISFTLTVPATVVLAANVIHVVPDGTTAWPCGDTWANACALQTALTNAVSGDEIWVTAGTYKPTTGTDRNATFQLKNGVALYGGFAGSETARDQRDWVSYPVILSGELGVLGYNYDNTYHIVTGASGATPDGSILDGFTISDGYANMYPDMPSPNKYASGMINSNSSPTIANVIFRHNGSQLGCSALQNINSSPVLTHVTFQDNWTEGSATIPPKGSAMCNESSSSPTMTHVTFAGNRVMIGAGFYGAALYNTDSDPVLEDVTFINNEDVSIFIQGGSPSLTNVTILNHKDSTTGMVIAGSSPVLTNVTIMQSYNRALYLASSANPTLRNTIIVGTCTLIGGATVTDGGGNLSSYSDCGVPTSAAINLDSPADNGGSTMTIPLLSSSAAIGAGVDANCPSTDQRGQPRYDTCDSGAYEYNPLPFVTTGSASAVTSTGATLNAFVNANTFATTATFEYGLTTSYGSTVAAVSSPVNGTIDTSTTAVISGLTPDTTYHFRIVGENINGSDTGEDQTFTTSVSTITYADPLGACGGHIPCYTGLQTALDAAPLNGQVTIYGGTYPESANLNRVITVTCQEDITLNGLTITDGTFVAPAGTLTLDGDLTHTGGVFDANGGSVVFTGSGTRTLTATVPTQFNNLAVSTGVTLVFNTNNDNVGVGGTLTNDGILHKSFGITGVSLDFSKMGSLSSLGVDRVDQNHPQAASTLQTGKYWSFEPNDGASGFEVNMTLPASFVPDMNDKVCRYTGVDQIWDCAMTDFDAALQTITRAGGTAFSDWAVGDDAGPTNVVLRALSAPGLNSMLAAGIISTLSLLALAIFVMRKHR